MKNITDNQTWFILATNLLGVTASVHFFMRDWDLEKEPLKDWMGFLPDPLHSEAGAPRMPTLLGSQLQLLVPPEKPLSVF